jgi:hypothetical protein
VLGDRETLEKALYERQGEPRLFDAGAVAEAAAMSRDPRAMELVLGAILAADPITEHQRARALLALAGNAAVGQQRGVLDQAVRAFDKQLAKITEPDRSDYALGIVSAYITVGDHAAATARMKLVKTHPAKAMVEQTIAALAGKWDAIQPRVFDNPALIAEVWAAVLRANADEATRARVLAALCP